MCLLLLIYAILHSFKCIISSSKIALYKIKHNGLIIREMKNIVFLTLHTG